MSAQVNNQQVMLELTRLASLVDEQSHFISNQQATQISILERFTVAAERQAVAMERLMALKEEEIELYKKETALVKKQTAFTEKQIDLAEKQTDFAEKQTALAEQQVAISKRHMEFDTGDLLRSAWNVQTVPTYSLTTS